MSIDISALSQGALIAKGLSNLILVSPQTNFGITPQLASGTTGSKPAKTFLFDFEGEQSVLLESDIPDHYAEDNNALNDQISNKPAIVNTHGFIGELNNVLPPSLQFLKTAADKLTIVGSISPQLSATALIAYNKALQAYQVAQQVASVGVQAWDSITGGSAASNLQDALTGASVQNKQQKAFITFAAYRAQKMLFTVQTPWAVYKNMAIKTMRAVQEEDTRVITRFEMTFKEFRLASTVFKSNQSQAAGRAADGSSSIVDNGVVRPTPGLSLGQQLTANNLA